VEDGLTTDDSGIGQIDWQTPWLSSFRELAERVIRQTDWRAQLDAVAREKSICNHRELPIRFVPQSELPQGTAYEAFISATGRVPTRSNRHDFFNALVWLTYPKIKRQLNALQAAEIEKSGAVNRGRVRDATTIFDENAALFVTADEGMAAALRAHRWMELFVHGRANFDGACGVELFGHAIMDKLVVPYKSITAHAWVVIVDASYFGLSPHEKMALLDSVVSEQMKCGFTTAMLTPLPVLGVPGWSSGQDEAFYTDQFVFRPKR